LQAQYVLTVKTSSQSVFLSNPTHKQTNKQKLLHYPATLCTVEATVYWALNLCELEIRST